MKTFPGVHLDLVEREDVLLEEAITNGELDFAVVTAWGSPRVATTRVLTEEISFWWPARATGWRATRSSLASLADESFLLPGHSMNMSNLLIDLCRRAGFEPRVPYRANYVELTRALVRQGLGVALLSRRCCLPETMDGLVTVPLVERPARSLDLIYRREQPVAVTARALMIHIRASVTGIRPRSSRCSEPGAADRRPHGGRTRGCAPPARCRSRAAGSAGWCTHARCARRAPGWQPPAPLSRRAASSPASCR